METTHLEYFPYKQTLVRDKRLTCKEHMIKESEHIMYKELCPW